MVLVIQKCSKPEMAKTVLSAEHPGSTPSPFEMSEAEFSATHVKDRQTLTDQIDRPTTAKMLGISPRTLDRWHDDEYGPKRMRRYFARPWYYYSRKEVEAWIAEHGRGHRRPRCLPTSSPKTQAS
jgi:hypothetical protein